MHGFSAEGSSVFCGDLQKRITRSDGMEQTLEAVIPCRSFGAPMIDGRLV